MGGYKNKMTCAIYVLDAEKKANTFLDAYLTMLGGREQFDKIMHLNIDDWQKHGHDVPLLVNMQPAGFYLGGRTLGIHPSMTEVRDLFNQGRLSFVANVGSLVRPTTW